MFEESSGLNTVDKQPLSKKDWTISELYSKSWQIIKNHKVTWIFGAAVAATAAGSSGNFNSSSGGDSESLQKLFNGGLPEASSSAEMSKVLGDSITPFQQLFFEIVQKIPMHYYLIFVAEILFLIVVGILITVIYKSWAHASLIESVYSAFKQGKTTIAEASEAGFKHIKSFIWLDIVPWLAVFLISFVYGILIVIGFASGNTAVMIVTGILALVGLVFLLYYAILISIGVIWAYREVAISDISAKQAFWNGFKIAKKKKSASLLLGFVNNLSTMLISLIPILILAGIGFAAVATYLTTKEIPYALIGIGLLVLMIVIPVMILLGAIIQAFKASVWTIAYDKIKGKYTNES